MRFHLATILLAALAGTAIAGHSHIENRVAQNDPLAFLSKISYAPVEDLLNQVLGAPLGKLEDALNFTLAQKLSGIVYGNAPLSVVVAVVEAVGELLGGQDIGLVDQNLSTNSNGYFNTLDGALGTTNIGEVAKNL
ncbi:hypothetical protein B0T10DRAFT_558181 [Thelonectria olida]|uniref:Uncharacterized protein n=1 Tax=Thelonectria olida TaxID=1576542 RepID=A0A9P9ATM1_9HYPO|nr:hypothetical protein B0T10DRAFT_558181 [Thelonectria olida]